MTFDPDKHHRCSIRLRGYDYTQAGAYFLTICTWKQVSLLGEIVQCEMRLNEHGRAVAKSWEWLAGQYSYLELAEWVVMPNHLHGVIVIHRGDSRIAPTKPLGRLVGAFKTVSTKRINEVRGTPGFPVWQRNFYEHIIRDEDELNRIRQYIEDNPLKWNMDRENPAAQETKSKESWQV